VVLEQQVEAARHRKDALGVANRGAGSEKAAVCFRHGRLSRV
jgi:hypothetical protein